MYAKIFVQIYDGTLCTRGPWEALVTFQQMLVLADQDGNVDMTAVAIARRTTIPLDIITLGIVELLRPDPESRTPTDEGRRIIPLVPERPWGWRIVNYAHYRALKREEDRRNYHREYWRKNRSRSAVELNNSTPTQHAQQNQPIAEAEAEAEAKKNKPARKRAASAPFPENVSSVVLVAEGFDDGTAADFIAHKQRMKAPLTARAWADHLRESAKAGWSAMAAAEKVMAKGWRGFEAKYVSNEPTPNAAPVIAESPWRREARERAHALGGGLVTARAPGASQQQEVFDVVAEIR